jgi:uncharacterized repeat protein (TIGR01451 family)
MSVGARSASVSSTVLVAPGKHTLRVSGVASGSQIHLACASVTGTVSSSLPSLDVTAVAGQRVVCSAVMVHVAGAVAARQDSTNADVSIFVDGSKNIAVDSSQLYVILLTISNLGNDPASNVTILNPVDSRFDIASIATTASNGAVLGNIVLPTPILKARSPPRNTQPEGYASNDILVTYTGLFPVSGTITIGINYFSPTIGSGVVDTVVVNSATVNATTPDSDLFNNKGSMNISVAIVADLDVSFSPTNPVEAGNRNPYSFTAFVCNKGPSIAENVVLNWEVPEVFGITGVNLRAPFPPSASCSITGARTVRCSGFNLIARPTDSTAPNPCLNVNGVLTCTCQFVSLSALVSASAGADAARAGQQTGLVLMSANTSSTVKDFVVADNFAETNVTVIVKQDVVIGKSGVSWVYAGGSGSYIIQVTNLGPAFAYGVLVNDTIPSQFIPTGVTLDTNGGFAQPGASCSFSGQLLTCPLGDMRPNTDITIQTPPAYSIFISVQFNVSRSATPTVSAPPANGAPPSPNAILNTAFVFTQSVDVNLTNNQEGHLIDIVALTDVFIAKACAPGPFISGAGNQFDYVLTVGNRGLSDARDVVITDVIPNEFNIISPAVIKDAPGLTVVCDPLVRTIQCSVIGLFGPNGNNTRITLTVRVSPVSTIRSDTLVTNTATVTTSSFEQSSTTFDNTAICQTLIRSPPDLSILKEGPASILLNDPTELFYYNITIRNNGPTTAENVGLVDTEIPVDFIVDTANIVISTTEAGRVFSFAGNCSSVLNCQFGSLLSGSTITVRVPFRVREGTLEKVVQNCANVTAFLDFNPLNDRSCAVTNITVGSDVFITKEASSPCAGTNGVFTLRVGNTGPAIARNVFVFDQIDARLQVVNVSPSPSSITCNVSSSNLVTCSLGNLPASNLVQAVITITVFVPGSLVPANGVSPLVQISNQARVSTSTFERPGSEINDFSNFAPLVIQSCPDIAVTKNGTDVVVAGRSANLAGVPYTYMITVRNLGPSNANLVTLTDTMPIGFIPISVSGPCTQGSLTPSGAYTFSCDYSGISFDTTRVEVVIVTYRVAEQVLAGCNYVNTVIGATPGDTNSSNNIASHPVCVNVLAPLAIEKKGPSDCVIAGETVRPEGTGNYVITVNNTGVSRAVGVSLTDNIPTPFVLSSPVVVTYTGVITGTRFCIVAGDGRSFTCDLFNLNPNEFVTVTYSLQAPANSGSLQNLINTATASGVQGCTFAQAGNCPITSVTATFNTNICPLADLIIFKSHTGTRFVAGQGPYTFDIIARNDGPSIATNVVITDFGFNGGVLSISGPGVSCTGLVCTIASLDVGIANQRTLTATFSIPFDKPCGNYSNFVNITAATPDPNPNNNQANDSIDVIAEHLVTISKFGVQTFVAGGAPGTHTVRITNVGPSTATNVVVTDVVPAGLPVTATSCGVVGQSLSCSFGNLNPNESRDLVYTIQVPASGALGNFINNARVTTGAINAGCEIELGTGLASLPNQVICEDNLRVTKTDNVDIIVAGRPGETFTYTMTVSNSGPSDSRDVVVEDVWPEASLTRIGIPATDDPARTCTFAAGRISCAWATLPVGRTVTIKQQFFVGAGTPPGIVSNTITARGGCSNSQTVSATNTTQIVNQADFSITKDDCSPTIVAGAAVPNVFTIRVFNAGPSEGINVVVTDFLPLPYQIGAVVANSINGVPPTYSRSILPTGVLNTWTYARFPVNETVIITMEVKVGSDVPKGWAHNCARVTNGAGIPDPDLFNNEDCDLNEICTLADVSVTKVLETPVDPDCGVENGIVAGNQGVSTYVVSVVNAGPSTARSVSFEERFPAGVIILSFPNTCTPQGNNVYRCTIPTTNSDLPVGTLPVQFRFTFRVASNTPKGLITNFVHVSSLTTDPDKCNNNFTLASPICVVSDLSIVKTDGVSQVTAGDGVVYRYNISGTNFGPSDAAMVVVNDIWPLFTRTNTSTGGFNIVGVTGANCSDTGSGLICTIGNVPVGGSYSFSISYVVDACLEACTMCNMASVSSMSVEPRPDPHPNTATDCNDVRTEADLEICKSDGVDRVIAGDGITYTYTIQIGNKGPSCARDVSLVDHWPVGIPQNSAVVTSVGTCVLHGYPTNPQPGNFSCNLGNFTVGQTATITVSYFVPSSVKVEEKKKRKVFLFIFFSKRLARL